MIRRVLACLALLAALHVVPARAERVLVGTMRQIANGALFLADAQGYFKAEGLEVEMIAYASESEVAEALAAGATDFALAGFTPAAFNYANRGYMKAIGAQVRERRDVEGNVLVVSLPAFANGVRAYENLAGRVVAIDKIGSPLHYQIAQIARIKKFDIKGITLKPMQSLEGAAGAVGSSQADAAILPLAYARELLTASQARFVGWYSELDEQQLGAVFASKKALEKRETVEKFIRAYRRGVADYGVMLRLDHGKRVSTPKSREIATLIARYVYPGKPLGSSATTVEGGAYFIDPQAKLDAADIGRQIDWYKAQGLIEQSVDVKNVVDTSFTN